MANDFNDKGIQGAPKSYEAAMARLDAPVSQVTMRVEVRALLENEAWVNVELTEVQALTKSRAVYELTWNAAGEVTR